MTFEIYFLKKFIAKISDGSFDRKISFIYFHSVKVKQNWAQLVEKKRPGAKIFVIFQ